MKVKVEDVYSGDFGYDCITVTLNGIKTQIGFDKKSEVTKLKDKTIELTITDGIYTIG